MSDDTPASEAEMRLSAEEVGVFLDRLRHEFGREPTPDEVVDRVLDPRDDLDKRAGLSFERNPERGHRLYLVAQARSFIRREKRPEVVIADGSTVEIPRSVSDPALRYSEDEAGSYRSVVVTDAGELAGSALGPVARALRQDVLTRVRASEAFLRLFGCWDEASVFVDAVVAATADHV